MINFERETSLKDKIIAFYDRLKGTDDAPEYDALFADGYLPHCAPLAGVLELDSGNTALLQRLAARGILEHTLYRIIADGDLVFAHVRYDEPIPVAGIDIFRFDADDRIAEHWNARQIIPHDAAESWDRFGGGGDTTTCIDGARRAELKAHLQRSQNDVWGQARADLVPSYYSKDYIQHNPDMPGGFDRILHLVSTEMKAYRERTGGPFPIDIHMMGANGDLVFIYYSVPMVGIGRNAGEQSRNADIFRIDDNNMLIEHWDVLQMASEPLADDRTLF